MSRQIIFKYPINYVIDQTVALPKDSHILRVEEQDGQVCIWAMLDVQNEAGSKENRHILMVGTGQSFADDYMIYLGTVFSSSGLVWHFFELLDSDDDA